MLLEFSAESNQTDRLIFKQTEMSYTVTKIWDRYREIMRMSLLGMKQVQIAEHLGLSSVCVGYVLSSPLIRQQIDLLQAGRDQSAINIGEQIEELAPKAIAYMNEVLDGVQLNPVTGEPIVDDNAGKVLTHAPELRHKVAKDLIGMAGFGPVQRVKATVTHGIFTPEDIARFKERAREAGIVKSEPEEKDTPNQLSPSLAVPSQVPSFPLTAPEPVSFRRTEQPAQVNLEHLESV